MICVYLLKSEKGKPNGEKGLDQDKIDITCTKDEIKRRGEGVAFLGHII